MPKIKFITIYITNALVIFILGKLKTSGINAFQHNLMMKLQNATIANNISKYTKKTKNICISGSIILYIIVVNYISFYVYITSLNLLNSNF